MARTYLTEQEYRDWAGEPTATVPARVLVRASAQVDAHLRSALYATDEAGYPVADAVAEALRTATAEQVYAYRLVAEAPQGGTENPLGRPLASATIDGVTWTAAPGGAATTADHSLPAGGAALCAAAALAVQDIPRRVWSYG